MLFRPELGLSVLELLGQSVVSRRWAPLQKQELKGSTGARPLPLRCLSQFLPVEEKINRLGNEVFCISLHIFHLWGGLVFIMDDYDDFPNWMMTLNSMFPSWMMILNNMLPSWRMKQYFYHWVGDFLSLS